MEKTMIIAILVLLCLFALVLTVRLFASRRTWRKISEFIKRKKHPALYRLIDDRRNLRHQLSSIEEVKIFPLMDDIDLLRRRIDNYLPRLEKSDAEVRLEQMKIQLSAHRAEAEDYRQKIADIQEQIIQMQKF